MGKKVYEFSSVQVNLPKILSDEIIEWGRKHVRDKDLYNPIDDPLHGRENEIHTTVLYGIHSQFYEDVLRVLSGCPPFEIKLGDISIFTTNSMFDVVKIEAISASLFNLNLLLKKNLNNTQIYNNYNPHVTIAYVKKNTFDVKEKGFFRDWKWIANSVVFSSSNGDRTPIRLNTLKPVYY